MYGKLLKRFISQSISRFLIYRSTSVLVILFGSLFTLTEIVITFVYFNYTDVIAGYTKYEFLLLIATFAMIGTLYEILFINSHENLSDKIINGELDYDFIRPVDSQFFNNLNEIEIPSIINLVLPIMMLIICLNKIHVSSILCVLLYLIFVFIGTYLYYLLNQFFVSLSFWVERPGKLLGVPEYMFEMANKPRMIFPRILQVIFAWIIPIISATNIPLEIITGNIETIDIIIYLAILTLFSISVRVQWKLGLKRYVSAN